jgi:hypothetical protein
MFIQCDNNSNLFLFGLDIVPDPIEREQQPSQTFLGAPELAREHVKPCAASQKDPMGIRCQP